MGIPRKSQLERKLQHNKAQWHLRQLIKARQAGRSIDIVTHEKSIQDCEKKLREKLP